MPHKIIAVEPGSIADQLGIRPGDSLVTINGKKIIDWIDYQAFCSEEEIDIVTERGGDEIEYSLEKDEWEPLGLTFDSQLLTKVRECVNRCAFCFVDQLPDHVRPSLRVKDDDWRLSLMMGNFVTMTNVSDRELERIIARHASPLYISVHTTNPELRARLLDQPLAAKIMKQLHRLAEGGISFHTQAVLCPGVNDGAELERMINDLSALWPMCQSMAIVPVGLTGHREGLFPLHKYSRDEARAVMDMAQKYQEKFMREFDTPFVLPSDEFYLAADIPLPPDSFYEDYSQIENGIGMMRLLQTEFDEAYEENDLTRAQPASVLIATGTSAAPFMRELMRTHPVPNVTVKVLAIENGFFGPEVTVAGLLTGGDIIRATKDLSADRVLITECMLRDDEDVFLDDRTLDEVQAAIGKPLIKVGRRGDELLRAIMNVDMDAPRDQL